MTKPGGSTIPTDPGGGGSLSSSVVQEYDRAYGHGYIAGMRAGAPGQAQVVSRSWDPDDRLFHRFLLGLIVGVLGGLIFGLFLGLFLAQTLKA